MNSIKGFEIHPVDLSTVVWLATNGVVVELQGDIDLHCAPQVHDALAEASAGKPSRIVVNMKNVTYIDSSGIGTLVEVYRRAKNFDGKLVLCCLSSGQDKVV